MDVAAPAAPATVAVPRLTNEAARRRALVVMRRRATGMLVVMTIVFVAALLAEQDGPAWVGYVRATPEFPGSPAVMDGASELLRDLFGADVLPARTAIGVSALPGGASVELDTIVKLTS